MAYPTSVNLLPADRVLVITANDTSSGELQWQDSAETATTITLGTVQRFGSFPIARQYTLTHTLGMLVDSLESTLRESGIAGMNCNLTTLAATDNLTIQADSQCVIYGTLTINGSLDVDGEIILV
jgi:hypothetical protein